jgi:hypothetical protein
MESSVHGCTPGATCSLADFTRCLADLRLVAGLTLRDLERAAYKRGFPLSRATASRLEGGNLPSLQQLRAYLVICDVDKSDVVAWEAAWLRLAHSYRSRRNRSYMSNDGAYETLEVGSAAQSGRSLLQREVPFGTLLEMVAEQASKLDAFVRTGSPVFAPRDPRLSVRIRLAPLGNGYFSYELRSRISYKGGIAEPKYCFIASGVPSAPLPVIATGGSLLYEILNSAESGPFPEFIETIKGSVRFRVGKTSEDGRIEFQNVDLNGIRESSEPEVQRRFPDLSDLEVGQVRILEVDLFRLEDGSVLAKPDAVEVRAASIYLDVPLNYAYWTSPGPAFLETIEIDTTEFQGTDVEFVVAVHAPNRPAHLGDRAGPGIHRFDVSAYIFQGHGVTITWRSTSVL